MIERGKISALQMAMILHSTIAATALLAMPSVTMKYAHQDMWLSPIWASLGGFLIVWITFQLHKFYPKESFIEYVPRIIGRFLGSIFAFLYLFFYWIILGDIVREYGEFLITNFLAHTPYSVISGSMLLVCAYAVRGGVEVIGRSAQFFVPIVMPLFLIVLLLLIPDLKPQNMLPMFEHGLKPSLIGAIPPLSAFYGEFFLISFLYPYVSDKQNKLRWGIYSVLSVVWTMLLVSFSTLLIFGKVGAHLTYPLIGVARYISLADFLEHLESIVAAIWVLSMFIKMTMIYYALSLGTAQWLKLTDYRPLIFPIGILSLVLSIWTVPNLQVLSQFINSTGTIYFLLMQYLIPLLLLIVAYFRRKQNQKKVAEQA
ncbi:spore germination protein KB [Seinonella peptonophila]|uniref:Spore germination protein KB n=1 Tax=Seinonella peptonophila TaxID=112248 RepID=A0A1M5AE60_9BACL|nr:endospore germination permease [Seinonella peptonophila]SHF28202.1 spore germination protein KB [Seinonella peptonophila]